MLRPNRLIPLLLLIATSCGPSELPSPAAPSEPTNPDEPARSPVYGGPFAAPGLTPRESSILAALSASLVDLEPDGRLVEAARRHASQLSSRGDTAAVDGPEHLAFMLHGVGGTDYGITAMVAKDTPAGRERLADFFARGGGEWTHYGVGAAASADRPIIVAVGARRSVELDPFPVAPDPGITLEVSGRPSSRDGRVCGAFLGMPDGSVKALKISRTAGDGRFRIPIRFTRAGEHQLEIQVESPRGRETAVLLPLYVGVDPAPRPVVRPSADGEWPVEEAAKKMLDALNRTRRNAGLPPLHWDDRLAAVARSHSKDMVALGYFGHRSPDGRLLADRLSAGGITPRESAENVARSKTAYRAHRNLLDSPSHRIHIMSQAFTHAGMGVEADGDSVVVTQVFARW